VPAKRKPTSASDVWSNKDYVEQGVMTQSGFSNLCGCLGIEEMSFEACYLMYSLCPAIEDVMTVCSSKSAFQRAVDSFGGKSLLDLPAQLQTRRSSLQRTYGTHDFGPFWRWLFEMGKAIAALNMGATSAGAVRSVPLNEGLMFLEAALGSWPLMPKLKVFCETKYAQAFTKDLWLQLGRFVSLTTVGSIAPDLKNYDDLESGGGTAWPCMIDDFVEFCQEEA